MGVHNLLSLGEGRVFAAHLAEDVIKGVIGKHEPDLHFKRLVGEQGDDGLKRGRDARASRDEANLLKRYG